MNKLMLMVCLLLGCTEVGGRAPNIKKEKIDRIYGAIRLDDVSSFKKYSDSIDVCGPHFYHEYDGALLYASKVKAKQVMILLVENCALSESFNGQVNEALINASYSGDLDMVKTLINYGADVNFSEDGDLNPLWSAIEGGNRDVYSYLLNNGADYHFVSSCGQNLLFPAVIQGDTDLIETLLALGLKSNVSIIEQGEERRLIDYVNFRWAKDDLKRDEKLRLINYGAGHGNSKNRLKIGHP